MKDLKECLVNESKTRLIDIKDYGEAWINEWGSDYCGNILSMVIKGIKTGMEKNKNDDPKFQKRCMDCIDGLLKDINKEIY